MTAEEVLRELGSGPAGLSTAEARRRLVAFGPNRLERDRPRGTLRLFARQFTHLLAAVLWVAAALSFVADALEPGEGMRTLGVAILSVIGVNGIFSFVQEHRAQRAIAALRAMMPAWVKALRDGGVVRIAATEVVPGDVILVERGDQIPADARVISGQGLTVSTAAISGESGAEPRDAAPTDEGELESARNCVLAGTFVVAGHARAAVLRTGMETAFGRLTRLTQAARDAPAPLQLEIARVGRIVAILATIVGVVCFGLGVAARAPLFGTLMFAIGIIVANVPEGLLPSVTLALALASQRMARRNALVRRLAAVEALGSATVICTDKTGTLTLDDMVVSEVFAGGRLLGDDPRALAAHAREHPRLFEAALLCHDVRETRWRGEVQLAGDPTEVALYRAALGALGHGAGGRREDEIPFDWTRRRSATLDTTRHGRTLHVKGAPEAVVSMCSDLETGAGDVPLDDALRAAVLEAGERMARRGLRVIAFATRPVPEGEPRDRWERAAVLVGMVGLADPLRPEVPAAVRRCREAGIRIVMITGDHPATALAIASQAGITSTATPRVVLGADLADLDDAALEAALAAPDVVFARAQPADKLRIVRALQRRGEIVAVTGDGVNDAPALRAAHIGVAMGLSGTDVAREAADLVLADDNFASIVSAVEEGRAVYANLRKFLTYILTSNVPELVPFLAYGLLGVPLALTILQILAVDLGTDMVPALALGAEAPSPETMREPPRARDRRLLDRGLLLRAYAWLGPIEAAAAMAVFFAVLASAGWRYGDVPAWTDPVYRAATTACLGTVVAMQIANVFCCRSERSSAFRARRRNPLLRAGIALELALLVTIAYTPFGHLVFATATVPPWTWGAASACAVAMLALEEGRKALARMIEQRTARRARSCELAAAGPSPAGPSSEERDRLRPADLRRVAGQAAVTPPSTSSRPARP